MTVSFSKQQSVGGDLLCNFRAFARDWDPLAPAPCTCSTLRSRLSLDHPPATCMALCDG
jgi:hypothetical protein